MMMENNLLMRSNFQCEVTAEQDERGAYLLCRPIVYESQTNIGPFDEIIHRGALDGANLKDVRFLVNHDTSKLPLARSRNNNANSTMQLFVDERGLAARVNLDVENNADAKSLYSSVQRGDVSGMSFLALIAEQGSTWDNLESEHPTHHIYRFAAVIEVSAVTFPAYEDTEIVARSKEALESARQALESVRSNEQKPLDSELEIYKLKNQILGGI